MNRGTAMSRHARAWMLATLAAMVLLAQAPSLASAAELRVEPDQMFVNTGVTNSTSTSLLATEAGAIMFSSNKSGDRNFHESYVVNSLVDFQKYFNIQHTFSQLRVEFMAEKEGLDNVVHKKVIRIKDEYAVPTNKFHYSYNQFITQKQPANQSSVDDEGFVEFYFLSESTDGIFMLWFGDHRYQHKVNTSMPSPHHHGAGHGINFGIAPEINGSTSAFFTSTSWGADPVPVTNVSYVPNKWYHVQIGFVYNESWSIRIDDTLAFHSTNWTINSSLARFDSVAMYTLTSFNASTKASHVFYIDALGLSYDMTAHNANPAAFTTFNANYGPYVDVHSINNLNDHTLNASLVAYFRFNLGERARELSSYKLVIQGYFTHPVEQGKLFFYDRGVLVYEVHDGVFKNYVQGSQREYMFTKHQNDTANISRHVGPAGEFVMKIEAQASANSFEYIARVMVFEFRWGLGADDLAIVIVVVIGIVAVVLFYKISQRGGYRGRSSRRRSNRR